MTTREILFRGEEKKESKEDKVYAKILAGEFHVGNSMAKWNVPKRSMPKAKMGDSRPAV